MAQNSPILSRINATEARQSFGNVIKRAFSGGEHLIVEKNELPVVVIIPIADYEKMREATALQNLQELGSALNDQIYKDGLTPEQIEEQIETVKPPSMPKSITLWPMIGTLRMKARPQRRCKLRSQGLACFPTRCNGMDQ